MKFLKHKMSVYEKSKYFKCEFCGKSYVCEGLVKRHVKRSHTEKKLSKCDICGNDYYYLLEHKKYSHKTKKSQEMKLKSEKQ